MSCHHNLTSDSCVGAVRDVGSPQFWITDVCPARDVVSPQPHQTHVGAVRDVGSPQFVGGVMLRVCPARDVVSPQLTSLCGAVLMDRRSSGSLSDRPHRGMWMLASVCPARDVVSPQPHLRPMCRSSS
ncbi:hypothetical protein J6590_057916 [Homalodisca vitripennis]|nr:hypothetical protein J6590_057916 [Homalodisca vitripennis]